MSHNPLEPYILTATYTEGHKIEFIFEDGVCGILDFNKILKNPKGILQKLKDVRFFRRVYFNIDTRTVEWPNRADFSPHYLYEHTLRQNPDAPRLNVRSMKQYHQYMRKKRRLRVPLRNEVSFFSDISITMSYAKGKPPHFRAAYKNYSSSKCFKYDRATFEIETGKIIDGTFHLDAQDFVEEWRELHLAELRNAWEVLKARRKPAPISPLD